MSLLDTREHYKPFDNPWMFDYYVLQNQMHWMPESVPLHTDVKDWQEMNPNEKNLLTQIFRLFTQSDVDVGAGYVDRYMRIFRKPEARMMMGSFANMESIHQHAYSLLLDTVGMPENAGETLLFCTNAVVASCMLLVVTVAVGAVGVPENAGLTFCNCT